MRHGRKDVRPEMGRSALKYYLLLDVLWLTLTNPPSTGTRTRASQLTVQPGWEDSGFTHTYLRSYGQLMAAGEGADEPLFFRSLVDGPTPKHTQVK